MRITVPVLTIKKILGVFTHPVFQPPTFSTQVTAMFNKTALISRQTTTKWMQVARGPKREIATPVNVSPAK